MAAITIDDTTKFVCIQSFILKPGDMPAMVHKVQHAVERLDPSRKDFVGSIVMVDAEKARLLVASIWESGHAWSSAQYDQEIGNVLSDVVEAATSHDIETYETVTVVRATR